MSLENYWNLHLPYNHSHREFFDYLGQTQLASQLCFIHEQTINPWIDSPLQNAKTIMACRQQTGRLPVLTLDTNPWFNLEEYLQQLDNYIDPTAYFVLASDIQADQLTRSNMASFPSCLCMVNICNQKIKPLEKKYRISFLSGTARYHRIALFERIRPFITDQDIVVINKFNMDHFISSVPVGIAIDTARWAHELPWQSRSGLIDTDQSKTNADKFHQIDHPAYLACVNITGESNYNDSMTFISEKTWKAYLAGCLVINFGTANLSLTLEKLGLWIWKDYDVGGSENLRVEKIIKLFQQQNIQDLYQQHADKILHNQNLVSSAEFATKLAQVALDKLVRQLRP